MASESLPERERVFAEAWRAAGLPEWLSNALASSDVDAPPPCKINAAMIAGALHEQGYPVPRLLLVAAPGEEASRG